MKKLQYAILFKFILLTYLGYTQTAPVCNSSYIDMGTNGVCDYAQWNWELPVTDPDYCKMWYAKTNFNYSLTRLGSPFVNPVGDKLNTIADKLDYTKANGWELIRRNFGCASDVGYPYFVLYNKYTGMIRAYVYINDLASQSYTGIVMTMKTISSTRTALTSGNRDLMLPSDNYLNPPDDNDELMVYVGQPTGMSNWVVGEFMTTFDPNFLNPMFTNNTAEISVYGIIENTITGQITGTAKTEDLAFYGKSQTVKSEANGYTKFNASALKALEYIKNAEELRKKINAAAAKVGTSTFSKAVGGNTVFQQIYSAARIVEIQTSDKASFTKILGEVIGAATGATNILKFVGNALGFLAKDETQPGPAVSPTITTYDLKLNGTITTKLIVQTIDFKVPGTNHTSNNNLTYYDCVMGTFNIRNKPVLEKISYARTVGITSQWTEFPDASIWNKTTSYSKQNYSSYRMTNDLIPVFNQGAGIELVSAQAALVGEIGADGNSVYNLLEDSRHTITKTVSTEYKDAFKLVDDEYINFSLADIEAGRLEITNYDVDNGKHIFQTPFVDINAFKGRIINVRSETKVYVRLKCILKVAGTSDNSPPIIFQRDYAVDVNAGTNPTNANYAAQSFSVLPPYSDITIPLTEGKSQITVSSATYPTPFTPSYYNCVIHAGCSYDKPGWPLVNTPPAQSGLMLEVSGKITLGSVTIAPAQSWASTYGGPKPAVTTAPIIFRAGNSIAMKPGFKVTKGSNFEATTNYGYFKPSPGADLTQYSSACGGYNNQAFKVSMDNESSLENTGEAVSIYPNPSTGIFKAIINAQGGSNARFVIYDQLGSKISEKQMNLSEGNMAEFNLSDHASGLYLVHIYIDGYKTVKSFVLNK